ncbi:hypothetical protein [Limosilactobacillus sp.]|uniref:hypothetical protein n=1 Tax=Limosilactobacillus sp. TaxID=2773925 RepID=UPI003F0F5E12
MKVQFKHNFYRGIGFYVNLVLVGICVYSFTGDTSVGEYIIDSIFLLAFIMGLLFEIFSVQRK